MTNFLSRLFGAQTQSSVAAPATPAPDSRLLPTDSPILCECGSEHPAEVMRMLETPVWRAFAGERVLASVITGRLYRCFGCGNLFAVGPRGRFTPRVAPVREVTPEPSATAGTAVRPHAGLKTPLERSGV